MKAFTCGTCFITSTGYGYIIDEKENLNVKAIDCSVSFFSMLSIRKTYLWDMF